MQSLWIGSKLGPLERLSLASFAAHGHDVRLYTYEPVEGVPSGTLVCDAEEILPRDEIFTYQEGFGRGSVSAFSNLFRYRLLHDRGGWWIDTDVVCLRHFTFQQEYVFATEQSAEGVPRAASCVLKSPAGSEYLKHCLEVVEGLDRDRVVWGQIGPQLVDDARWRFGLDPYLVPTHFFNPINYFDFRDMVAPAFDFTRLIGSFAVHLWHQMWVANEIDVTHPPPDSLLGKLYRTYLGSETA